MAYDRKFDFKLTFSVLFIMRFLEHVHMFQVIDFFHASKDDFMDFGEIPHELNVKNKSVI